MGRIFGLDLLRTISIWLVLIQHAGIHPFGLTGAVQIGGVGVDVFFVLSGFLIGSILLKALGRENSMKSIWKFLVRRWFRILPVYYLVILFKFAFLDHSIGMNIFYYLFFLQNNFFGIHFFSVTWSLVIEEWFYLFAPVFLYFSLRIFRSPSRILPALLLFLFAENLLRFVWVYLRHTPYAGVNSNFLLRFDSLFLGVILAYFKLYKASVYKLLQGKVVFFSGLSFFCLYLFYISQNSFPAAEIDGLLFPRTIGFFILSLSIALIIPFIDTLQSLSLPNFISRALYQFVTWTSLLTYSIYLVHTLINQYVYNAGFPLQGWGFEFLVSTLLTYLLAWLIYTFYEKPILDLRERFA